MSHENSVTVLYKGKWFNIPTKFGGQQLTSRQAADLFRSGKIGALGNSSGFESKDKAVRAARTRSKRFGTGPRRHGE